VNAFTGPDFVRQRSHEHQRCCARHEGQKLGENNRSEVRQAMAEITLARTCPYMSMAPVLAIIKLVAAAARPRLDPVGESE
jgi:truncated hemoglobin YjbI